MSLERRQKEIKLPVSGRRVLIQEGDGYTDKILTQRNKSVFEVIPEYLASLVVEMEGVEGKVKASHILDLLGADQDHLSLECYKVNYGDTFEFSYTCPECGATAQYSYDLNKINYRTPSIDVENPTDPTVSIVLPRTKKRVTIGLLNGHKESVLARLMLDGTFDPN
ncbi:MAG: hypothetical protein ACP5RW_09055, partial [bacterium]